MKMRIYVKNVAQVLFLLGGGSGVGGREVSIVMKFQLTKLKVNKYQCALCTMYTIIVI